MPTKDAVEEDPSVSTDADTIIEEPSTVRSPSSGHLETSSINLHLTRKFRIKLRIFSAILFLALWGISFGAIAGYLFLWNQWPYVEDLTNAYSAFFGFITALVFNVIGCTAALATFKSSADISLPMDAVRSTAVCLMLSAGVFFNIVFPTAGLLPLEIDSRRRIPGTTVMDCTTTLKEDQQTYAEVPECQHADNVKLCLFATYSVIPLEVIALISFMYLKHVQGHDIMNKKGVTPEETLTTLALREGCNVHHVHAGDGSTYIRRIRPTGTTLSATPKATVAELLPGPSTQPSVAQTSVQKNPVKDVGPIVQKSLQMKPNKQGPVDATMRK